jgi:excisionase family DNA binding protein
MYLELLRRGGLLLDDLLTVKEAAEFLRISVSSMKRLLKAGAVPYHRVGSRRIVVSRADLEDYLQRRRHGGNEPAGR